MLKTMVAVFSVPLMAQANIVEIDLQPIQQFIAGQSAQVSGVETAQIRAAVQTLKSTAQLNEVATDEPEDGYEKTDQQHFAELMASIDALSKQVDNSQ